MGCYGGCDAGSVRRDSDDRKSPGAGPGREWLVWVAPGAGSLMVPAAMSRARGLEHGVPAPVLNGSHLTQGAAGQVLRDCRVESCKSFALYVAAADCVWLWGQVMIGAAERRLRVGTGLSGLPARGESEGASDSDDDKLMMRAGSGREVKRRKQSGVSGSAGPRRKIAGADHPMTFGDKGQWRCSFPALLF